jgi:sialate O-acetylesterase
LRSIRFGLLLLLGLTPLSLTARAEVRLPHVLSSHAVLQRGKPIHIWGWSSPDAHLTVHFHGQSVATTADSVGEWSAWLKPEAAGGPYTLTVTGDGPAVKATDIMMGDLWFAGGQSNMQIPLDGFPGSAVIKNAKEEIANATHADMRLLLVSLKSSPYPLNDTPDKWELCTPATAQHFSAVAYFFGRELAEKEHVTVGLIDSTWGGTPIGSWISMDTLGRSPQLLPAFLSRAKFADGLERAQLEIAQEKKEDAAARAAGKPIPPHPWHPAQESWIPSDLYNGMIAPFTPLQIRGVIWYQGENNTGKGWAEYYSTAFPAMIRDWRMHFAQGNFPFLFVQISSYYSPGEDWGMIRDAQRRTLRVANTAMAVSLDKGLRNNIHPPDKQTVGHRLALAAEHLSYGADVAYQSPLFRQATTEQMPNGTTAMRVWFNHAQGLTSRGKPLTGFELAGANRQFVPAQAKIEGDTVVVWSAAMPHPKYVRYGWGSYVSSYLYNAAGLPASTFTSEKYPKFQTEASAK